MLHELSIEGLLIFSDARIEFGEGLNVISGETGAGKSVLLQALLATLGEDPPKDLLRDGSLESVWSGEHPQSIAHLLDEERWAFSRLVRGGRSSALCGGRSVAASLLREAASDMIVRSGQHSSAELRRPGIYREMLDQFGEVALQETEEAWDLWREAQSRADERREWLEREQEREDFLRHEVELLEELSPRVGEEEDLEEERERLLRSEERREALRGAEEGISLGENAIGEASASLEKTAEYDRSARQALDALERALEEVREAQGEVRSLSGDNPPEGRLDEIESRLLELRSARRRFRVSSVEELVEKLEQKQRERDMLEGGTDDLEALEREAGERRQAWEAAAEASHEARLRAAKLLEKKVRAEASGLALESEFVVRVQRGEEGRSGFSEVLFALQGPRGETPLQEGASGGELSRIELALRLASGEGSRVYIFDEIDTGIGGETAHLVADKLFELSRDHQVIVVTHLPQIAIRANHLLALRRSKGQTEVRSLQEGERREEIARLAGARGEESGAFLEEMLRDAAGK